jgi:drug/metabolite transporter (DMT)-like permease
VLSRRLLSRIDALGATAVLMVFGALGVFLVGWPALSGFDPGAVPPRVWALAAYIVVFPTALAYLLLYWTLARVGSYLVALFVYLQPIIATALSAALLGERPGPGVLLGGGLVFLGVYLALPPAAEAGRAAP